MKSTLIRLVAVLVFVLLVPMAEACDGFIMAWCNWQSQQVEVWQYPCIQLPFHLIVSIKKLSFFGIEIDVGLGPYTIIPNTINQPDYQNGKMLGTLSGDCVYNMNLNLGHPNEMGSPIANAIKGALGSGIGRGPTPHAIGLGQQASGSMVAPSLLNTFPYTCPVAAALPPNFPIPETAVSGTCDSSLSMYQVEHPTDMVAHFSVCPSKLINQINVCSNPLQLAVTPDASTVLVTCYNNAIQWIDTSTDTVTFTLMTSDFPNGIAISPDGSKAYVTNYFDSNPNPELLVIDVANHTILNTIPLPAAFPGEVTLTPDGTQAWVNYYQSNFIDIVDLNSGTLSSRIDLQENVQNGIAFNPTGTRAYVASGTSDLAVIDTATLQVLTKISVIDTPLDVIVSPDGTRVLVGSYSQGAITIVNTQTNQVVQTIMNDGAMQGLNVILGSLPLP